MDEVSSQRCIESIWNLFEAQFYSFSIILSIILANIAAVFFVLIYFSRYLKKKTTNKRFSALRCKIMQ